MTIPEEFATEEENLWKAALTTSGFVFVGLPFDVVKLRLQTQGRERVYKGVLDAIARIAREEGVRALWKGGTPSLVSALLGNSVKTATSGLATRTALLLQLEKKDDDASPAFTANTALEWGIVSLVTSTIVAVPENIKAKLQFQRGSIGQGDFRGPLECMTKVFKREGIQGLFRGYSALLLRDVPATAVAVGMFRSVNHLVPTPADISITPTANPRVVLASSSLAAAAIFAVGYPVDVVKAHMQTASGLKPLTLRGAFRTVYVQHGLRGYFRGASAAMLGALIPAFGITLCSLYPLIRSKDKEIE